MANQVTSRIEEQLGLGDHVAFFFKSNEERLAVAIPYILNGLRNSERCVYVADENSVPRILTEFERADVTIGEATASGSLSVVSKHDAYLRYGIFEPEKMVADLDREVKYALQNGFRGLRVTGEMSWALDLPYALSKLCEYEDELCRRWPRQLAGLCQYNESLFPPEVVERMAGCHRVVARGGTVIRRHAHPPNDRSAESWQQAEA